MTVQRTGTGARHIDSEQLDVGYTTGDAFKLHDSTDLYRGSELQAIASPADDQ